MTPELGNKTDRGISVGILSSATRGEKVLRVFPPLKNLQGMFDADQTTQFRHVSRTYFICDFGLRTSLNRVIFRVQAINLFHSTN